VTGLAAALGRLRAGSGAGRALAAALDLRRGERVLAVAALDGGGTAVATTSALAVVDGTGPVSVRWRRDWVAVDRATWDDEARLVRLTWVDGGEAVLPLAPQARRSLLPEVVRERVQASVVLSRQVEVTGRRGVRVVVRRGHGGGLAVQVLPDPGVDLDDPRVAERVARCRADVAGELGLPPSPVPGQAP
jgi:hypothetical protein